LVESPGTTRGARLGVGVRDRARARPGPRARARRRPRATYPCYRMGSWDQRAGAVRAAGGDLRAASGPASLEVELQLQT
jgi:hypothetical protein